MHRGYHTYLAIATSLLWLTVSLHRHRSCPLPGLRPGASTFSTGINPEPNIPNRYGPKKIYPTYVSTRPMISSHRRSSPIWHHNKYQPTWYLKKYLQQTLGLPRSPSGVARSYIFGLIWRCYGPKQDILDYWGTLIYFLLSYYILSKDIGL